MSNEQISNFKNEAHENIYYLPIGTILNPCKL